MLCDLDGHPFVEADYYGFLAGFAPRFVKLVRAVLGIDESSHNEVDILMRHMALFELFPYASRLYRVRYSDALSTVASDRGCLIAAEAALGAIKHRAPAAVLLNGRDLKDLHPAVRGVDWTERPYTSRWDPAKTLHHWEGLLTHAGEPIPVFAFPQRSPSSHNSNLEVEQLGEHIAEVVRR